MGTFCSFCRLCGGFEVNEDVEGQDRESLSDMMRLGLSRSDINKFYRAFKKVDRMNQNCILIADLLRLLGISAVPLTIRAFGELDLATDGMLNMREFTLSAWTFCARRQEGISDMAFTMYDKNNSGDLSTSEISMMVRECYGDISDKHNVWAILDTFDSNGDAKVSRSEFNAKCKKFPALLAPAIEFQTKLKSLVSNSSSFWNRIYQTSSRTMHSKKVKMLFRMPDKIDSVRDLIAREDRASRAENTSHVKGFSYNNNMGVVANIRNDVAARRGQDKWKVDKSVIKPKTIKKIGVKSRNEYGLFD